MKTATGLYSDRLFIPTLGKGREEFVNSLPKSVDCCKCVGGSRIKGWRKWHSVECDPSPAGKGRGGSCENGCGFWVHVDCGKPSFSFSNECQVCSAVYMPAYSPEFDWLCGDCGGQEFQVNPAYVGYALN